jgi:hypothetical protein
METSLLGRPAVGSLGVPTTAQDVEAGNTLDLSYPTSSISGGVPAGWGATCERYVIGAVNGGSYRQTSYDTGGVNGGSFRGFQTEFEFLLVSETFPPGGNTVAISKAYYLEDGVTPGTAETSARNWRLYVTESDFVRFILRLGEDDGFWLETSYPSVEPGLQVNTAYRVRIDYDLVAGEIRWWVNDALILNASRAQFRAATTRDMPRTVAHQIMGSSASSDGRSLEFLLTNINWTEIPVRGAMNLRQRIFAPGLAR